MNPLQRGLAVVGLLVLLGAAAWLVSTRRHQPNSVNPTTPTASVVLDQARQQDIWRAEHTTFEIERRFGPAFLEALNSRDTDRLAGLATPQLKAFGLGAAAVTERRHGDIVELSRTRDPNEPPDSLTAIGLAETLVRIHSGFSTPARSALRVLQITEDPNRTDGWTARVLLTSIGTTAEGHKRQVLSEHTITGIVHDGKQLGQAAWLDGWTVQRTAQRHGPAALFREVTANWGLDRLPIPDNWNLKPSAVKQNRFQYAVADFNHDGRLDVAVAALGVPPLLLAGDPAEGFRGVATQVGLVQGTPRDQLSNTAVAWIDFDNDGWPDLLLGERLYRNQDGRTFVDVTGPSGLGFLPECMGCLVADYDADGRLDLYVLYQKRLDQQATGKEQWIDETGSGLENQLWKNQGGGRFKNVTQQAGAGGGKRHTHAAAWFFLDDDHLPDLYLANDFGRNVVLRNRGDGSFEDVSPTTGANGFATSMGVATGDLDNDGHTDVYVANMYSKMGRRIIGLVGETDYPQGVYQQIQGSCAGNRLYHGQPDGRFQELSDDAGVNAVGWAYAPVLADLDADGRLDIYATTGFLSFDRRKPDG